MCRKEGNQTQWKSSVERKRLSSSDMKIGRTIGRPKNNTPLESLNRMEGELSEDLSVARQTTFRPKVPTGWKENFHTIYRSPDKQPSARKSRQNGRRTFGGSIGRPTKQFQPNVPTEWKEYFRMIHRSLDTSNLRPTGDVVGTTRFNFIRIITSDDRQCQTDL